MAEVRPNATYREVFALREFRALWSAELFSVAGDQLARVALSVLVFRDTGSAALTGLTYALTYAPSLLGGILLAGLADRYPRREVMVATDVVRALLIVLVAVPGLPLWTLGALVGLVSLLNPLFKSAQLAVLPDVLAGDRYHVGMAIRSITVQFAQLVGFAGGGVLTAALDSRLALVLDAATFAMSAVIVRSGLRPRLAAAPGDGSGAGRGWLRNISDGGRLALASKGVRTLMLLVWTMAAITAYEGLAAPYAAGIGGGSITTGLLLTADPIGGVIGVYLFTRWVPAHVRPRLVAPFAVLAAAILVFCLLKPGLGVSLVLFKVSGGLGTIVVLEATTLFTQAIPNSSRAQVLGLSNTGLTTATGLSPLFAGILADQIGASEAVGWFGLGGLVLVIIPAVLWSRVLRDDPRAWSAEPEPKAEPRQQGGARLC